MSLKQFTEEIGNYQTAQTMNDQARLPHSETSRVLFFPHISRTETQQDALGLINIWETFPEINQYLGNLFAFSRINPVQSFAALKWVLHSKFPFQHHFLQSFLKGRQLDHNLMGLIGLHIPCLNKEGREVYLSQRKRILFRLWACWVEKAKLEPIIHGFFFFF